MPGRKRKAKASLTAVSFLAPIALVQVILIFVFALNIFFIAAMDFIYTGGVPTVAFYILAAISAVIFIAALYLYWRGRRWPVYILAAIAGTLLGLLLSGTFAGALL